MENIKLKKVGTKLVIEIDTTKRGELSSTGRSRVIAKTNRFEQVDEEFGLMLMLTKKIPKGKAKPTVDDEDEEPTPKRKAKPAAKAPAKKASKKKGR